MMTNEEQRIAIAEACGWKFNYGMPQTGTDNRLYDMHGSCYHGVPDYLNDLNAMHEAEKTLYAKGLTEKYVRELKAIIKKVAIECYGTVAILTLQQNGYEYNLPFVLADQRAEAFLRTIGKWKE